MGSTTSIKGNVDITGVVQVVTDGESTHVLKEDGTVWSCGANYNGQLGLGLDDKYILSFTQTDIEGVKTLLAPYSYNERHFGAVKQDGTFYTVGLNDRGQLGLGDIENRNIYTKVSVEEVKTVSSMARGYYISKEDGTIYATGQNTSGQLGLGDTVDRYVITKLPISGVKSVFGEVDSMFILTEDNKFYATGRNTYGQLGLGDTENRTTFTQVTYYADGTLITPEPELPVVVESPKITTVNQTVDSTGGTISVGTTTTEKDLEYALNKGIYQDSNEFSITESGDYTITIKEKEETDILDEVTVTVDLNTKENTLNILNPISNLLVGSSLQLKTQTIKVAEEMGIAVFNSDELVYESSNPKVASVDENGKVKALKQGNTVITVYLGDLEATLDLEVLPITNAVDGNGDIIINGEIQALVMSLTVPQAVDFVINPNTTEKDETFISPKFYITNNSALDIGVTVEKLTVAEDSQYTFTDVDKDTFTETEWYRLSSTNSMKYLALRIVPQDNTEWVNSDTNECQAIDTNIKLGIIPSYKSTTLKLEANHGTALQPVTCKYNTVFVFEIDNLVE